MKEIARTAEAVVYKTEYLDLPAAVKQRLPKAYRNALLDQRLREKRITLEAGLIARAKKVGVQTPVLYKLEKAQGKLWMEWIEGVQLHKFLETGKGKLCKDLGKDIARLHAEHMVHGDLTSSNVLVSKGKLCLLDFGLGNTSTKNEDKAVDLLNFKKTLTARYPKGLAYWKAFVQGYEKQAGKQAAGVLKALEAVENRVRYAHA